MQKVTCSSCHDKQEKIQAKMSKFSNDQAVPTFGKSRAWPTAMMGCS